MFPAPTEFVSSTGDCLAGHGRMLSKPSCRVRCFVFIEEVWLDADDTDIHVSSVAITTPKELE